MRWQMPAATSGGTGMTSSASGSSVRTIMNHWGNNSVALEKAAGPGRWNDPARPRVNHNSRFIRVTD